jgi:nitrate/nitrite-specific signal transduction histidine kinase
VLVGIPKDVAFAAANANQLSSLIGIGVVAVVVLALGAAWVGGDAFVLRPTRALVAATRGLTGGDFNARTGLKHGPGELGEIARAFDGMAGTLKEREADRERAEQER